MSIEFCFNNLLYDAGLGYPTSVGGNNDTDRTSFSGLLDVRDRLEEIYGNANLTNSRLSLSYNGKDYNIITRYKLDQWAFSKISNKPEPDIVIAIHGEKNGDDIGYYVINIDKNDKGFKNECTEKQWDITRKPKDPKDQNEELLYQPEEEQLLSMEEATNKIIEIINTNIKIKETL